MSALAIAFAIIRVVLLPPDQENWLSALSFLAVGIWFIWLVIATSMFTVLAFASVVLPTRVRIGSLILLTILGQSIFQFVASLIVVGRFRFNFQPFEPLSQSIAIGLLISGVILGIVYRLFGQRASPSSPHTDSFPSNHHRHCLPSGQVLVETCRVKNGFTSPPFFTLDLSTQYDRPSLSNSITAPPSLAHPHPLFWSLTIRKSNHHDLPILRGRMHGGYDKGLTFVRFKSGQFNGCFHRRFSSCFSEDRPPKNLNREQNSDLGFRRRFWSASIRRRLEPYDPPGSLE